MELKRTRRLSSKQRRHSIISSAFSTEGAVRFLILFTLFAAASLFADPVLNFDTNTAHSGNNFNQTVGWKFDVVSTITVTGLGWYDQGSDGLQLSHTVGIWSSAGNLLASATVGLGTTDPLDGLFRTASIAPLVLAPGNYIVGGQNFAGNTEQMAFGITPVTDPSISFIQGEFSAGATFEFPTEFTSAANCCWGPSFSIGPASVPEPAGASALLAIGILGAALLARRSQRAAISKV